MEETRMPVFEELNDHIEILTEEGHDVLETLKIILDESFDCEIVEKAKFEELERIATEYEANKHYIELGKAVKEAFERGYSLDAYEFDECDDIKIVDSISSEVGLLEWAESEASDA